MKTMINTGSPFLCQSLEPLDTYEYQENILIDWKGTSGVVFFVRLELIYK